MRCKNTGAPFPRGGGTWVDRNEVFDATESELKKYAHKLRPVDSSTPTGPPPPKPDPQPSHLGWPLEMRPDLYVKLHPDGKHADLARRLLEKDANGGDQDK